MLANQRKRQPTSTRSTRRPLRSTSANSNFQNAFRKSKGSGGYCQYVIWGAFALALCTTIFLLISVMSPTKSKHSTTIPDEKIKELMAKGVDKMQHFADLNLIDKFPEDVLEQMGGKEQILKHLHHLPESTEYVTPNDNEVKVTFNLYSNTNCDESDPSKYTTITKMSKDVKSDSIPSNGECVLCYKFCDQKINENDDRYMNERGIVGSIKIISSAITAQLDLYDDCGLKNYHSSVFEFEKCVHIYDWPGTAGIIARRNMLDFKQILPPVIDIPQLPPLQHHLITDGISVESKELSTRTDIPSYVIVYSCESSEYCAFQAQANYYGYLTSGQHPTNSGFLRLLTAQEPDDMASYIPTFTAPRNLYSRRYSPYNKADVLVKWFESTPNRPTFDIVVVIDPDNWIIRDITHWIVRASEGHALGEAAWFHGSALVTQLWKEVCLKNCDAELDMVGVPYIVHKNDLEKIAPYFKMYIDLMKEREEIDKDFLSKYKGIQMGWGTEMFGYIFGAAHAGIKHEVVHGIQRRDVSARPNNKKEEKSIDMIHMGRAWMPHHYEPAKIWWHTEGKAWSRFGAQVWCKCNYTASDIIPWPLPLKEDGITPDVDFQSYHTLYLLHYGREYFGELPASPYRKPLKRYHEPYP